MTIRAIVTDIEGTTSSIDFVHQTLFPYAREHLPDFVRAHAADPAVASQLEAVADELGDAHLPLDEAIAHLIEWIDEDRKVTPLKALQGMLWAEGYHQGHFTGHVYADTVDYLRCWHAQGIRLYVYSSGSVQAQELLFGYSDAGDLRALFSGFFDTTLGGKRDAASYQAIAQALMLPAAEILFLSDLPAELVAARQAGLNAVGLARAAQPMSVEAAGFEWCRDFAQVEQLMRAWSGH